MNAESKTCSAAVAGVQRLRELARSTGYPPTGDAELARLIAAVESAADAVRTHAQASIKERSERDQPRLF
jgi:hypothetical protein